MKWMAILAWVYYAIFALLAFHAIRFLFRYASALRRHFRGEDRPGGSASAGDPGARSPCATGSDGADLLPGVDPVSRRWMLHLSGDRENVVSSAEFQQALTRGLREPGTLHQALFELGPIRLERPEDVRAVSNAIGDMASTAGPDPGSWNAASGTVLELAQLLEKVGGLPARAAVARTGVPILGAAFDRAETATGGFARADSALMEFALVALEILGEHASTRVVRRIARTARGPLSRGSRWDRALRPFSEPDHPLLPDLLQALREPLPEGTAAFEFLNVANRLAIEDRLDLHPFRCPAGVRFVESCLTDRDPDRSFRALRATTALPFLDPADRSRLLAIALDHPDSGVQMEAAWASARAGSEAGRKMLLRLALDVHRHLVVRRYLTELGLLDRLPQEAREPGFQAMAEISEWLASPMECSRAPDDIAVHDTRELYWPPTRDHRRLWLVRYAYEPRDASEKRDEGVGMVGSITFALFGNATLDLPVQDLYGLHCAWELRRKGDPRISKRWTATEGRQILARHNPAF